MENRERIVQIFFFGFLALIAWELYRILEPFLNPIAWAMLLAFLVHPLLLMLDHRVKHRSLSAIILTVVVSLVVILPAIWLSGRLVSEAQHLYKSASALVVGSGSISGYLAHSRLLAPLRDWLGRRGIKLEDEAPKFAVSTAKYTSDYVVTHLANVARNLVLFVVDFGLMIVTFFYLLRDGEGYYEALRNLTPMHEEDKKAVFDTLRHTLSSVMRGLMLTALLQGVTIGLGLLIFGVPYWLFLALAAAAFGLLPIGGTAIVWLPAAGYLFYAAGWGPAVGLLIWCAIAVAIIDNFLKPLAMRHGTGLPTIALFFGIAGGLEVYGPIGIFAGPAIIAVFAALLRVYRRTYGEQRPGSSGAPPDETAGAQPSLRVRKRSR